jgi:NADPH:quinone reductase-like Zn-dependent oxidoreductase
MMAAEGHSNAVSRIHAKGGLKALVAEQFDTRLHGRGELLVRLRAAALNHRDIWIRMAHQPQPLILH